MAQGGLTNSGDAAVVGEQLKFLVLAQSVATTGAANPVGVQRDGYAYVWSANAGRPLREGFLTTTSGQRIDGNALTSLSSVGGTRVRGTDATTQYIWDLSLANAGWARPVSQGPIVRTGSSREP